MDVSFLQMTLHRGGNSVLKFCRVMYEEDPLKTGGVQPQGDGLRGLLGWQPDMENVPAPLPDRRVIVRNEAQDCRSFRDLAQQARFGYISRADDPCYVSRPGVCLFGQISEIAAAEGFFYQFGYRRRRSALRSSARSHSLVQRGFVAAIWTQEQDAKFCHPQRPRISFRRSRTFSLPETVHSQS